MLIKVFKNGTIITTVFSRIKVHAKIPFVGKSITFEVFRFTMIQYMKRHEIKNKHDWISFATVQ